MKMISVAILLICLTFSYGQEEALFRPSIGFALCGTIQVQTISACLSNGKMFKIQPFTIPIANCTARPICSR
jgi:hypothetical protein